MGATSTPTPANELLDPVQSYEVSTDLSGSKYCGVVLNSSRQLALPAAGGGILGVLLDGDANAQGKTANVACVGSGRTRLKMGGTTTTGDYLKVDSQGRFVTASATDISNGSAVAYCTGGSTVGLWGTGVVLGGAPTVAVTGVETVTTGNLSASTITSNLSIDGTKAFTLPDGKFAGQRKRIECTVATNTPLGTLTITTPAGSEPSSHVFTAVGQTFVVEWTGTGWHMIEKRRAGKRTFVMGTTAPDTMSAGIDLSVTGTQSNALPNGNVPGERIHISVSTAATLPSGTLTGTYKDKTGVAKTVSISGIDATGDYAWLEWDGSAWNEIVSTGLTFN